MDIPKLKSPAVKDFAIKADTFFEKVDLAFSDYKNQIETLKKQLDEKEAKIHEWEETGYDTFEIETDLGKMEFICNQGENLAFTQIREALGKLMGKAGPGPVSVLSILEQKIKVLGL